MVLGLLKATAFPYLGYQVAQEIFCWTLEIKVLDTGTVHLVVELDPIEPALFKGGCAGSDHI